MAYHKFRATGDCTIWVVYIWRGTVIINILLFFQNGIRTNGIWGKNKKALQEHHCPQGTSWSFVNGGFLTNNA